MRGVFLFLSNPFSEKTSCSANQINSDDCTQISRGILVLGCDTEHNAAVCCGNLFAAACLKCGFLFPHLLSVPGYHFLVCLLNKFGMGYLSLCLQPPISDQIYEIMHYQSYRESCSAFGNVVLLLEFILVTAIAATLFIQISPCTFLKNWVMGLFFLSKLFVGFVLVFFSLLSHEF